uniref:Uncharacterized protein n=1 Tax=Amphimedon queenslandica TaxID=400682 RepID=A0A1X7UKP4_AMPQE
MAKNLKLVFITSFSAVIVLIWDHLLHFQFGIYWYYLKFDGHIEIFTYTESLLYLSFPFFGLLADVWIGRYKAILIGMILCFISWIMSGIGFIMQSYDGPEALQWLAFGLAYLAQCVGLALFTPNIIQYIIDQLVGASADELNTVIYWHCAASPLKSILFSFVNCSDTYEYINLIMFILSGVAVSIVLVSHSFFKHKLENISLIKNPIKLIVRVLCYARKHKYPENRSALTYWEEEAPSRLDLGKNKYGGPFTIEEVEDVKTVFRIIPIFIAVIGVFFYKYIPSMLRRMSFGLVIALLSRIPYLLPFLNITWKEFVSQALLGISYVLVNPVSLEFVVAQSPVQTRGLMVGLCKGCLYYTIDQLVGASADELSTVIYWHCAALPIQHSLFHLANCSDTYKYHNLIMFILSGVAVSLVLVSHSFFKHKLENMSLIKNPIKLIVRVLCYARKHKYPENRSALTYWEEEAPSRIDLGKDKYGGPFTVEEVEDYVPNVLRRMSLGLVIALLSRIPIMLPFLNNTWKELVSQILMGISYVLANPVSLEFVVAQSPVQTRGLMVGIWYTSWQIVFVILAKRYKYRVRENEVNIHQIADDHYQRYMEQEDRYKKQKNNTNINYIVQDEQFCHNQQENNVNFDPVEQLEEFRHNQQENNINIKFNS